MKKKYFKHKNTGFIMYMHVWEKGNSWDRFQKSCTSPPFQTHLALDQHLHDLSNRFMASSLSNSIKDLQSTRAEYRLLNPYHDILQNRDSVLRCILNMYWAVRKDTGHFYSSLVTPETLNNSQKSI